MQNTSTHKYMEKLDLTWSDDSIRFINTATPSARQTFFYVQEVGDFLPLFHRKRKPEQFSYYLYASGKRLAEI